MYCQVLLCLKVKFILTLYTILFIEVESIAVAVVTALRGAAPTF